MYVSAGRSDWDHGRWEWEDTPRRDGVSSSRRHQPSPSPMFVGASPDARLVSPWHTPHSSCMLFPFPNIIFVFLMSKFDVFNSYI
jgi:hypothetical protein